MEIGANVVKYGTTSTASNAVEIFVCDQQPGLTDLTLLGDGNKDGLVDFNDYYALYNSIKAKAYNKALDVNRDGVLDNTDMTQFIALYVAHYTGTYHLFISNR